MCQCVSNDLNRRKQLNEFKRRVKQAALQGLNNAIERNDLTALTGADIIKIKRRIRNDLCKALKVKG